MSSHSSMWDHTDPTVFISWIRQPRATPQTSPLKQVEHFIAVIPYPQQSPIPGSTQQTLGIQTYFLGCRAVMKMWNSVSKFITEKECSTVISFLSSIFCSNMKLLKPLPIFHYIPSLLPLSIPAPVFSSCSRHLCYCVSSHRYSLGNG